MNIENKYLDLLEKIISTGVKTSNRTGIDTYKIPPTMIQHDMSNGFPILTTKKIAWKTLKVELEGFIKGITSKSWFQERGCTIWNEWCNPQKVPYANDEETKRKMKEEDDLGKIYGYQWRNFGSKNNIIVELDKKQTIFECNGKNKFNEYKIKYCNIACKGNPKCDLSDDIEKYIFKNWYDMINRCYNQKASNYKYYGMKNVKVCDRWLCYENYRNDIEKLPRWQDKIREPKNYSLDKDYFGSNVYAPDVCIFLHSSENRIYNSSSFYKVYNNDECLYFLNHNQIANFLGFTRKNVVTYLDKDKEYCGYKIENCAKENKLYRYMLPVDQLKNIINTLKNNSIDRRMICSAWNSSELNEMALVPCHYSWQVLVRDGKLDLVWNQRSVDVFLGLPFNIASYGLLLHLLAKESGFEEGILTGFLSDVHIYENHLDQVNEQLSRTSMDLPEINTDNFKSIFDWEYKDSKLINYNPCPAIKAEVAV